MGIKGLGRSLGKIYRLGIICFIVLLFSTRAFAQETSTNVSDNMKFVRVAISDTGFKSTLYNQLSIIATGEFAAYEKNTKKLVAKFGPTDVVLVKYCAGKYDFYVNNAPVAKAVSGIIVFDCPHGLLGVQNLKRSSKPALYHGVFELTPKNECQFNLVNVLDLQSYLKGVVPNEMPVRFGLEALKAQAVAARNYVLLPRSKTSVNYDVDDSVASQVYFGANTESPLANQAVNETDGLVALDGWDLILAQYCSTAGGYTEDYGNAFSDPKSKEFPAKVKPYLKGRPDVYTVGPLNREEEARLFYMSSPDSYDMKSPYYRWQKSWDAQELTTVLQKTLIDQSKTGFVKPEFKQRDEFGVLKEIKVNRRGVSGKAMELEIVTDKSNWHVYKELVIRRVFQKNGISLPSANVVFENLYDTDKKLNKVVAYGGGFGHGVGMSQFGAGFMGTSLHKTFDKILKRYYSGITISTVPVVLSKSDNCEYKTVIAQDFYTPRQKAILVVDNKYNIKNFNAIINGRTVAFELSNSLVPIHRISRIDISGYVKKGKNTAIFYFPECENNKAIRLYIEVFEKDDSDYNF